MLKNDGIVPDTWWTHSDAGHNDEAKKELLAVLPEAARAFSTPKPTRLISRILEIATQPGDLVLDFFAGSGTTAHAVLKMNAEAKEGEAPRKFILVSSTEATSDEPDKNLCRDVCRQRVANVIDGYGDVAGTGGTFSYLRTRRIPANRVVRKIDHSQVWLALQLMHFSSHSTDPPVAAKRLYLRDENGETIYYLASLTKALLARLEKELEHNPSATLYSWQPEAVEAHFPEQKLTVLPIPQTLIDRFGLRR